MDLAPATLSTHEAVPTADIADPAQTRNEVLIFDKDLKRRVDLAAQIRELAPDVTVHISATRGDAMNHVELDRHVLRVVIADSDGRPGHAAHVAGTASMLQIPKSILISDRPSDFAGIHGVEIWNRASVTRQLLESALLQQ